MALSSKDQPSGEKGARPDVDAPKASDLPDPNPHVAGQTPAGETDQPDYSPATDFASALGEAQLALTNIHYDQSQVSTAPEHLDPLIEKLEEALKAAKAAQGESKS
jgi:hypothetical protein